jgi:hypothetical protein
MMQVVDRPGLLNTPESSESGDAAARRKSRFTPDAVLFGGGGISGGAAVSHADDDDPLLFRPVRLLDKPVHVVRIAGEQHDWAF